jgi:hypothetical protein
MGNNVSSIGGNVLVSIGLVRLVNLMGENNSDFVVLVVGGSVGLVEVEVSSVGENVSVGIGLEVPINSMGEQF